MEFLITLHRMLWGDYHWLWLILAEVTNYQIGIELWFSMSKVFPITFRSDQRDRINPYIYKYIYTISRWHVLKSTQVGMLRHPSPCQDHVRFHTHLWKNKLLSENQNHCSSCEWAEWIRTSNSRIPIWWYSNLSIQIANQPPLRQKCQTKARLKQQLQQLISARPIVVPKVGKAWALPKNFGTQKL